MLTQGRLDVLFVGILVLLFSVLFPVGKLIAAIVVVIFMAYIGFSGIVGEQLRQLEGIGTNIEVLTTIKSNF
jgi:hypothetical protein